MPLAFRRSLIYPDRPSLDMGIIDIVDRSRLSGVSPPHQEIPGFWVNKLKLQLLQNRIVRVTGRYQGREDGCAAAGLNFIYSSP